MAQSFAAILTTVLVIAAAGAEAHDLPGLSHESARRSTETIRAINPQYANLPEDTRSVISKLVLWSAGSKLTVCFYGGSPAVREKIARLAARWTADPEVTISLDFGAAPEFRSCSGQRLQNGKFEDIRISFAHEIAGHWSEVGIDSHRRGLDGAPSMNLQGFDLIDPSHTYSDYVVIHEFGHALGLEHEHQSPGTTCESEFDLKKVKDKLKWDDAMIMRNFKVLEANSRKFEWSAFDPLSIMMYSLDSEYFKKDIQPLCQVAQNQDLSNEDKRAMRRAYARKGGIAPTANRSIDADRVLTLDRLPASIKERASLSKSMSE